MTVICQVLCWTCLVNVAAMAIDGDGQRHIHDLEAPDCLRSQIIVCHHIGTLDALGDERRCTTDCGKVDCFVADDRIDDFLTTGTFAIIARWPRSSRRGAYGSMR